MLKDGVTDDGLRCANGGSDAFKPDRRARFHAGAKQVIPLGVDYIGCARPSDLLQPGGRFKLNSAPRIIGVEVGQERFSRLEERQGRSVGGCGLCPATVFLNPVTKLLDNPGQIGQELLFPG